MRGEKFHGAECINEGHGTLRYRSTGGCVACIQNAARAKREKFKREGRTLNPREDVARPNSRYWVQWLLNELRREVSSG